MNMWKIHSLGIAIGFTGIFSLLLLGDNGEKILNPLLQGVNYDSEEILPNLPDNSEVPSADMISMEGDFPYKLDRPDEKYKLPEDLNEVSGLTFLGDNKLGMVQDEKGHFYTLDWASKKMSKNKFHKSGDYEGVEMVGNLLYVLRSDGDVYQVTAYLQDDPVVQKFENALSDDNNTEGLAYNPADNTLLIACKESPNLEHTSFSNSRAIYRFSLKSMRLDKKPAILISLNQIKQYVTRNTHARIGQKLESLFDSSSEVDFKPSGIAVHPLTGEVYIIATAGKLLVVYDFDKGIKVVERLDDDIFKQPEGICFSPTGDLFISNEARKGQANILRFSYNP